MKQQSQRSFLALLPLALVLFFAFSKRPAEPQLKTFLIERTIPGAGKLSAADLKAISQASCSVLKDMKSIEWVQSYVTGDAIFCIYRAENEALVREHAKKGGFPANRIIEVNTVISPKTAE